MRDPLGGCVCACVSVHANQGILFSFLIPPIAEAILHAQVSPFLTHYWRCCVNPEKRGCKLYVNVGMTVLNTIAFLKTLVFKNNVSKWRPGSLHSFGQFSTLLKRSLLPIDLLAIFLSSARFQQHGRHSKTLVFKWTVKVSKISLSTWANGYIMNVALFFDFGFHCHLPEPTNSACPISLI